MKKKIFLITAFIIVGMAAGAQNVGSSPDYIKALTSEWKGERF